MELIAYNGDKKLKASLLKEITKHEKADAILQGTYGKENGHWKGCAVACSLRSLAIVNGEELVTEYNQHERYETGLGISQIIARLEDRLFEGMTAKDAKTFPRKFAEAVPVGADLSLVPARFMIFCVEDTLKSFDNEKFPEVVAAVKGVSKLWQDVIDGKYKGKDKEQAAARSAGRSAARSAGRSAARSAAWSAAWSAWSATWSAAESAAWSAASAAAESATWSARSAARSAAFKRYADYLLKLLKESPLLK